MLESEYERTGDGYHAVIWVSKRRERMKDETRGITNEIQQGSKAVRNVKEKDLDHLKDYVKSVGFSGQSFLKLREDSAEEDGDDSPLDEDPEILAQEVAEEVSKKRRIDLGTAITDLYAKERTALDCFFTQTK